MSYSSAANATHTEGCRDLHPLIALKNAESPETVDNRACFDPYRKIETEEAMPKITHNYKMITSTAWSRRREAPALDAINIISESYTMAKEKKSATGANWPCQLPAELFDTIDPATSCTPKVSAFDMDPKVEEHKKKKKGRRKARRRTQRTTHPPLRARQQSRRTTGVHAREESREYHQQNTKGKSGTVTDRRSRTCGVLSRGQKGGKPDDRRATQKHEAPEMQPPHCAA